MELECLIVLLLNMLKFEFYLIHIYVSLLLFIRLLFNLDGIIFRKNVDTIYADDVVLNFMYTYFLLLKIKFVIKIS